MVYSAGHRHCSKQAKYCRSVTYYMYLEMFLCKKNRQNVAKCFFEFFGVFDLYTLHLNSSFT